MTRHPMVSIVIPSYNQGRFLEDAIQSVVNQDDASLEALIMDGGSTDESVDVITRYASRLAYWVSEPDGGQAHAINKGFARATGEIVTWLNADDVYLSRRTIADVVRVFQDDRSAGVVYGDYALMDEAGVIFRLVPGLRRVSFRTFASYCLGQPSAFIRREVACRFALREALRYGMDYEYWLRLSQAGVRFRYVPRVCSVFRAHARNKSTAEARAMAQELREIRRRYFNGMWHARWPIEPLLRRGIGGWLRLRGLGGIRELYRAPLAFQAQRLPLPALYASQVCSTTFDPARRWSVKHRPRIVA